MECDKSFLLFRLTAIRHFPTANYAHSIHDMQLDELLLDNISANH